jgi:uroporphyrinogen III methyltransferase/synthase
LTLRGAEILADADFVLFDPEVHPDVLGRLREGTPRHPIQPVMTADRIAQMLAHEAKNGRHAVRLAWADPLLFGWGDVEATAVARQGVHVEIVPGVSAFTAVGAFAATPLTRAGDASPSLAVVSVSRGHESLHDWDKLTTATDTLAILCDADSVGETARSLVFYGRAATDRVTIIEHVSLPTQTVVETTLGEVPLLTRPKSNRVVLVVGERTARLPELLWFERQPLFGKRVLVTRAREQAGSAASLLRERGADPVVIPTIEIHAPSDPGPMIDAAASLADRYGWVVFTSSNGVERLFAEVKRQGKDARAFGRAKIAAIGPGTAAALERVGLRADLVAKEHKGEGLASELVAAIGGVEPKPRVLVARAEVARDVVPDALRGAGCEVDVVAVYKTRSPPRPLLEALSSLFESGEIDAVTFTSSSTVDHLCDALEARAASLLAKTCVASIGPITTETAKKRGIRVDVVASEHTIPGLVTALERHFEGRSGRA